MREGPPVGFAILGGILALLVLNTCAPKGPPAPAPAANILNGDPPGSPTEIALLSQQEVSPSKTTAYGPVVALLRLFVPAKYRTNERLDAVIEDDLHHKVSVLGTMNMDARGYLDLGVPAGYPWPLRNPVLILTARGKAMAKFPVKLSSPKFTDLGPVSSNSHLECYALERPPLTKAAPGLMWPSLLFKSKGAAPNEVFVVQPVRTSWSPFPPQNPSESSGGFVCIQKQFPAESHKVEAIVGWFRQEPPEIHDVVLRGARLTTRHSASAIVVDKEAVATLRNGVRVTMPVQYDGPYRQPRVDLKDHRLVFKTFVPWRYAPSTAALQSIVTVQAIEPTAETLGVKRMLVGETATSSSNPDKLRFGAFDVRVRVSIVHRTFLNREKLVLPVQVDPAEAKQAVPRT